jgi:hypothetical protein
VIVHDHDGLPHARMIAFRRAVAYTGSHTIRYFTRVSCGSSARASLDTVTWIASGSTA